MKQFLTTYSKKMPTTTELKLFSNHRHSSFSKYSFCFYKPFSCSFLRSQVFVSKEKASVLQCPVSRAVLFHNILMKCYVQPVFVTMPCFSGCSFLLVEPETSYVGFKRCNAQCLGLFISIQRGLQWWMAYHHCCNAQCLGLFISIQRGLQWWMAYHHCCNAQCLGLFISIVPL